MEFWVVKLAGMLLLPPLSLLLLALLGLLLARRWRSGGLSLALCSLAALWLLSTPVVSNSLLAWIEPAKPDVEAIRQAGAIVVLGGGTYFDAPEFGGDTVGAFTLERLRWAARLHRETGLPVMVTGGLPLGNTTTEAAQMKDALSRDFGVKVKWLEDRSDNTLQSAGYAREILAREGIARIALVTHASHMRRARRAFVQSGFDVVEAPTGFSTSGPLNAMSFLPNAWGMVQSRIFFHEALGTGWYHVRRFMVSRD